ncbi:hypothetical protein P148_SR1C00001G0265 [candidate division SR1 bacterium RAAC1_SR1_1]|nr:hypothetical protein P148_SR1C00001G0265 [candidate division SR1 bacterium RAAC1_SR1_1]
MITLDKHYIKRFLRYIFFVTLILWIISSIFILYKYVWFSSNKTNSKGGTFVEGIFDSTSYLPYLRTDGQSSFYQGLLFNSCLKYSIVSEGMQFKEDLCNVNTKDNKTYTITVHPGTIWSDGTPLSLDDILFTYQDIIIKNKRGIRTLTPYKDVKITKESDSSFKVVFPTTSIDNKLFFTQYILPLHILKDFDFQSYRELFAVQPIYTNCANIVSQTSDQYSLIFNLVNCTDTSLNFYQIKNHLSFDAFNSVIDEKKSSIVDVYLGDKTFPGYEQHNLFTNKIITVFFNTNSDKLRVRTRRALGGLIKRNFYSTGYNKYLLKNTDGLFDVFLSTGTNIKEYLNTSYDQDAVVKKDLIDSGIEPLPRDITIKGENKKFVFYTETEPSKTGLAVFFDTAYDRIAMQYGQKLISASSYSSKNKKAEFILGTSLKSFGTGLNKYIILGWKNNKKITLATVDVYNVTEPKATFTGTIEPLSVLYYDEPLYQAIVLNLQSIFTKFDIGNYFTFEPIKSLQELEGRLVLGDYDIMINTIDMGLKKDITKLFATDSAMKNPSQYQNTKLISLLQQYTDKSSQRVLNEVNNIYAKDMPFVVLGKAFVPMQVKINVAEKLFGTGNEGLELYDYNRRELVYKNLKLVNTVHIDGKKIWNYINFSLFIKNALGLSNELPSIETPNDDVLSDTGSDVLVE